MNRIDRLFGIATMLQSKKFVPAEKIADKYDISLRTVYRDVKALTEQGIPVSFEQNRGYFLVQGYFLPPVSFTAEEANAFLLMEKAIYGYADRSIFSHYSSGLSKLKAVMRGAEKDRVEQLSSSMLTQVPESFDNNFDYLATVQSAISSKLIIETEYQNKSGKTSRRKLEPIGLVFYGEAWHLIAWCHLRKDYRDFKVVRFTTLTATRIPFTVQNHIHLNEYIAGLKLDGVKVE